MMVVVSRVFARPYRMFWTLMMDVYERGGKDVTLWEAAEFTLRHMQPCGPLESL